MLFGIYGPSSAQCSIFSTSSLNVLSALTQWFSRCSGGGVVVILSPGDIWKCLETFCVDLIEKGVHWLMGRGQGCYLTPSTAQGSSVQQLFSPKCPQRWGGEEASLQGHCFPCNPWNEALCSLGAPVLQRLEEGLVAPLCHCSPSLFKTHQLWILSWDYIITIHLCCYHLPLLDPSFRLLWDTQCIHPTTFSLPPSLP